MTISRFIFVSGMLTVLSTISLFAQTFGEVTGHISDPTGADKTGTRREYDPPSDWTSPGAKPRPQAK